MKNLYIPKRLKKKRSINCTAEDLINFEKDIEKKFNDGEIPYPIHLSKGNENELIEIFKFISKNDWIFSSWRNHYHALLKGLKSNDVKKQILKGKSMNINDLSKKFFTSSIVGGIIPIALGTALAIKLQKKKSKVWVFIGDMTYETGGFYECYKYSKNFKLPIKFIVEDNNMSTNTKTNIVWGKKQKIFSDIVRYKYKRKYPHHGIGKWILF